jgi:hypothetical protein
MKLARVFPIFSIAFAALYVVVLQYNLPLITYHPAIGEWEWWRAAPKAGPAMYWYGLVITSALGAAAIAAIAALLPPTWLARISGAGTWVVPAAALATIAYILRGYFFH